MKNINTNERNSKTARAFRDAWNLIFRAAQAASWTTGYLLADIAKFLDDVCPRCASADHSLATCDARFCSYDHNAGVFLDEGRSVVDAIDEVRQTLACPACSAMAIWPHVDQATAVGLLQGGVVDISDADQIDDGLWLLTGQAANLAAQEKDVDFFHTASGRRVWSVGQSTEDGRIFAAADGRFYAGSDPALLEFPGTRVGGERFKCVWLR